MYVLPKLDYSYDALKEYIDEETMRVHHTGHHARYVENANKVLSGKLAPQFLKVKGHEQEKTLRESGGGHYNHSLFWKVMTGSDEEKVMDKELEGAIVDSFGSIEKFIEQFTQSAASLFGSGWVWLCAVPGKLSLFTSTNQENPLMTEGKDVFPILALDVWEHAYYLKYKNKRPEYINSWWNTVNWSYVSKLYKDAKRGVVFDVE